MTEILIKNDTNSALFIADKTKLGKVIEYKADVCYQAHFDTASAAPINIHRTTIHNLIAYNSDVSSNKTVFKNRIKVYEDPATARKLTQITQKFEPS